MQLRGLEELLALSNAILELRRIELAHEGGGQLLEGLELLHIKFSHAGTLDVAERVLRIRLADLLDHRGVLGAADLREGLQTLVQCAGSRLAGEGDCLRKRGIAGRAGSLGLLEAGQVLLRVLGRADQNGVGQAGTIQQNNGGQPLHAVLIQQTLARLHLLRGDGIQQLLGAREIQGHDTVAGPDGGIKLRAVEDFVAEVDAGRAPIRAGEVQKDAAVLCTSLSESLVQVLIVRHGPSAAGGSKKSDESVFNVHTSGHTATPWQFFHTKCECMPEKWLEERAMT